MKVTSLLKAALFTISLASAAVYADTTNPATTGAPDNSAATAPATNAGATADNNLVNAQAQPTAKKLQTVNINSADATTLQNSLKGIGPKRAAAIIAYRTQNGPFKSVDDLTKVKGISQRVLNENRSRIALS